MRKNLLVLALSFSCFLLFILFSYIVHKNVLKQFDFNTTVILQDHMPRRFDNFFSFFSDIGSFEPVLLFLIVLLILRRKILAGLGSIFLFGIFHIFELYGKFFVDHPPPPEFMLRTKRQVDFPQFHVRAEFSYPSGHSGRALFVGTFLMYWILRSKLSLTWKIVLLSGISLYICIMLVSRIYLGEHWTTDVIGGSLLGLALGVISGWLFDLKLFRKRKINPS